MRVTTVPLNKPYTAPIKSETVTAGIKPRPLFTIRAALPVEIKPTTEPTDKSISPSKIIIVIPIAIMPFSLTARSTFIKLRTSRNKLRPFFTQMMEAIIKIAINAI